MPAFRLVPTAATVSAAPARRTISGLAVPWGVTAAVQSGQRVRFERDSIVVPEPMSRVTLLDDHSPTEPTGYLASAVATHQGLAVTFQLGTGPRSDAALRDALELVRTGLSVGVDTADAARPPLTEPDGTLVFTADRPAILRETSQLALPAYTDARVTAIAAAAPSQETPAMPETLPAPEPAPVPPPAPAPAVAAAAPAPAPLEVPTAVAAIPAPAPAAVSVGAEPFPYSFAGVGPSMLMDYVAAKANDRDAIDRLQRASAMMAATPSTAVLAGGNPSILAALGGPTIQAAPGSTSVDVSDLAQTMHRPDLWLPLIERMTPLYNATTKVPLEKPNPFLYPATVAYSGLPDATPAEGTNPTPGTISTDPITVTPALVHGSYEFTRTLLDSASPAIDMVAAQAIQEAIARDIEAKVYTNLATSSTTATGAITTGAGLLDSYRGALADFMAQRYLPATHLLAANDDYKLAVQGNDTTNRPLIPPTGATNAVGAAAQAAGSLDFYNLEGGLAPAWAITVAKSTYMVRSSDVITFATPIQSFRFEEKSGPELIELAFRMYLVVHTVRAVGVMELIHT